ncbi:beta-N-acetylhexosaminidase [Nonomuraea sp. NPDC050556]|uniref:beta-N-acetylhexosaminidase n=1 Tax=Nonomuraea sp. NPDC050556 TaxID=3364369 RepID=UPI0037B50D20
MPLARRLAILTSIAGLVVACGTTTGSAAKERGPRLVPLPASVTVNGETFTLGKDVRIAQRTSAGATAASALAKLLRRSTGFAVPIVQGQEDGAIVLEATGGQDLGPEGYRLEVTAQGVSLVADTAEGLFRGVQTLRQLLPAKVESATAQKGPWPIAGVRIEDRPRFPYRGVMLDVARHFFTVAEVKRYIDLAAAYKINTFHLHLTDDQGWRIAIKSWPLLTATGGKTAVDGDPGGFYTQADYRDIVAYAKRRFITVIPEIDTPGHTNAALASYAKLNCDGKARKPYTGTDVGFSSLCTGEDITYRFLDDVIRELAAMTPGPYINIGGDEALSTKKPDYQAFVARVQKIVHKYGKRMMGWEEIGQAAITKDSVAEHWNPDGVEHAVEAAKRGAKLVMAPANHAYLDMKYTKKTPLGQDWAAIVEVRDGYSWDPATIVKGVGEDSVLGVEAPLWTETLKTMRDLEFMAYPRLPGIAEIGWSRADGRSWSDYRVRLAAHGDRWSAQGIDFYRSPQIPWD